MRSEAIGLAVLCLAGCVRQGTPPSQTPARAPARLTVGPIAYFQVRCARCHGPYGAFYPDSFRSTPADVIAKKTDEMCRGQGGLALEGVDLEAQVGYQRSLQGDRLFVAITSVSDGLIEGEATPGAKVEIVGALGRAAAEVDGYRWRCTIPASRGAWRVEATMNAATAVLKPENRPFVSGE